MLFPGDEQEFYLTADVNTACALYMHVFKSRPKFRCKVSSRIGNRNPNYDCSHLHLRQALLLP